MRRYSFLLLSFVFILQVDVFSQSLTWGKSISGPGYESLQDIGTDSIGNVYAIGWFNNTVDFDPSPAYFPLNATASGGNSGNWDFHGGDIFITKWDEQGNFIWAKNFACKTYNNQGVKIAVAPNGVVYGTGYFTKDGDFDPGPSAQNLNAGNGRCIFLSKLDANGNLMWAKQFGDTSGWSRGHGVKVDSNGDVILHGSFEGQTDFDPGSGVAIMDALQGGAFLCKYSPNGDLIWNKQFKLSSSFGGPYTSIDVDQNSNIFVIGSFSGTVDVDPGLPVYNLQTAGTDACILKLAASGGLVWAKNFSGGSQSLGVALDISGNIYCTGYYSGTCDFDPGFGTFTISTSATADTYVAKLDPTGNLIWVQDFDAQQVVYGVSLATDAGGNVFVGGDFAGGSIDCDPGPGVYTLSGGTAISIGFMCCWNKHGKLVWAGSQPGPTISRSWAIHGDKKNNVYFGGTFWGVTDIDPFSTVIQYQAQGSDAFLCKAFTCSLPAPLTGIPNGSQNICEGDAATLTYTANSNVVWFNSGVAIGSGTFCTTPGLTAGSNTVFVRPENTCGINPSSVQLVINLSPCVSITEYEISNSIKIYPNPSNGPFNLDFPDNMEGQDFFITNSSGQSIFQGLLSGKSNTIDVTLTEGIYLLHISNGQSLKFSRF